MAKKRAKKRCKHSGIEVKHSKCAKSGKDLPAWADYAWCEPCKKGWQYHIAQRMGLVLPRVEKKIVV